MKFSSSFCLIILLDIRAIFFFDWTCIAARVHNEDIALRRALYADFRCGKVLALPQLPATARVQHLYRLEIWSVLFYGERLVSQTLIRPSSSSNLALQAKLAAEPVFEELAKRVAADPSVVKKVRLSYPR